VERGVLLRFSSGNRDTRLTLMTDGGTQFILPSFVRRSRGWESLSDDAGRVRGT
jgi:hypothetical protein